jgi:hypothetical protein
MWNSIKGHLININSFVDPSAYKEISIRSYWISNNLEIWNYLTLLLGSKAETCYTPTSLILNRIYINSILVKFWRVFEIEIKEDQI